MPGCHHRVSDPDVGQKEGKTNRTSCELFNDCYSIFLAPSSPHSSGSTLPSHAAQGRYRLGTYFGSARIATQAGPLSVCCVTLFFMPPATAT